MPRFSWGIRHEIGSYLASPFYAYVSFVAQNILCKELTLNVYRLKAFNLEFMGFQ